MESKINFENYLDDRLEPNELDPYFYDSNTDPLSFIEELEYSFKDKSKDGLSTFHIYLEKLGDYILETEAYSKEPKKTDRDPFSYLSMLESAFLERNDSCFYFYIGALESYIDSI